MTFCGICAILFSVVPRLIFGAALSGAVSDHLDYIFVLRSDFFGIFEKGVTDTDRSANRFLKVFPWFSGLTGDLFSILHRHPIFDYREGFFCRADRFHYLALTVDMYSTSVPDPVRDGEDRKHCIGQMRRILFTVVGAVYHLR